MDALISPAKAEALIVQSLQPLSTEEIAFDEALGRTLRESLQADRDFPPFDRVMMDGIACRQQDLALAPLTIQGHHPAGAPSPEALKPGHCWQIATGAVLPPDCDTVVPVEDIFLDQSTVTFRSDARTTPGNFIHRQGSDCLQGTTLLSEGTILNPTHLGLAATLGKTTLTVSRQPRITLISTGDEMIPPSETPRPHQLRQSNAPTLAAALQSLFFPLENLTCHHLDDDQALTERTFAEALRKSDLILITGGISKGQKDFVRPALQKQLGPPLFHGVAQRPGKPLAFWSPGESTPPVFALPGNPNSAFTTFHRYVRPALRLLAGSASESAIQFPLANNQTPHPTLTLFLPANFQPDGHLRVTNPQNSGDLASSLQATGFVEISPGTTALTSASYRSFTTQL